MTTPLRFWFSGIANGSTLIAASQAFHYTSAAAAQWATGGGNYQVQSGHLQSNGASPIAVFQNGQTYEDQRSEIVLTAGSVLTATNTATVFVDSDGTAGTGYKAVFDGSNCVLSRSGTVVQTVAHGISGWAIQHRLRIERAGGAITVWVDGALLTTYNDGAALTNQGYPAFALGGAAAAITIDGYSDYPQLPAAIKAVISGHESEGYSTGQISLPAIDTLPGWNWYIGIAGHTDNDTAPLDNKGNTFVAVTAANSFNGYPAYCGRIYRCLGAGGGTGHVISVPRNGTTNGEATIFCFATDCDIDGALHYVYPAAAPLTGDTLTATAAGRLAIGMAFGDGGGSTHIFRAAGYTSLDTEPADDANHSQAALFFQQLPGTSAPFEVTSTIAEGTQLYNFLLAPASVLPTIDAQPTNQTGNAGNTFTFSGAASSHGGTGGTFQWQQNDGSTTTNVGTNSSSYSGTASGGLNGYQYRLTYSDSAGTATSNWATLSVISSWPTLSALGELAFGEVEGETASGVTNATIAAVDGADVPSLAVSVTTGASVAASDGPDAAAVGAAVLMTAQVAATDSSDQASAAASVSSVANAGIAATDGADAAAVGAANWTTGQVSATDGSDSASIGALVTLVAGIAATDGSDTAAATAAIWTTAQVGAVDSSDTAAVTAAASGAPTIASIAATDSTDTASVVSSVTTGASIVVADSADSAASSGLIALGQIAATDGADSSAVAATAGGITSAAIAATDGQDAASTYAANWTTATLAAIDAADSSSVAGRVTTGGAIWAADGADSAAVVSNTVTTAGIAAIDGSDSVGMVAVVGEVAPASPHDSRFRFSARSRSASWRTGKRPTVAHQSTRGTHWRT